MAGGRPVPIVVGVSDVVNRSLKLEDAREPLALIVESIRDAINDTGIPSGGINRLISSIDSISTVRTWTWPYGDLPGLISKELGAQPKHMLYSGHGGNEPGKVFDEAARRVASGLSKVAVVTGGEALASLGAFAAAKELPPLGWTKVDQSIDSVFSPTTRDLGENLGAIHKIGAPIHVYPLYENGYRAHYGQSMQENNHESAQMYANFAKIAQHNRFSWNFGKPAETEQSIGTLTKRNRMICSPYPLLMNAFNNVNLAAACILTSVEYARDLGIPEGKWIYALGGAGTRDKDFWLRPSFYTSPAISQSIDAALKVSCLKASDIDLFDLYSCFPIVPKIACKHLQMSPTAPSKPITLLGGLTSFGGAGNNYSLHAITEMTRQLRQGNGQSGLVLANGGVMSYQHALCLSTRPRSGDSPYPTANPLGHYTDVPETSIDEIAEGQATIETYTVEFDREGAPVRAYIVGQLRSNGRRFLANHGDDYTLRQLAEGEVEPIGRLGRVQSDPSENRRNLFHLDNATKL